MFGWLKRMDRHSGLITRMAEAVNADLGKEARIGLGRGEHLRSLMIRCTDCEHGDACEKWLQLNAQGTTTPPAFCRNREALVKLNATTDESSCY